MSIRLSGCPLIFTHYGNSPYLQFTLKQASISNPSRLKILIGDLSNKRIAESNGWEHVLMSDLVSEKRDEFNARFFWVQGKNHNPVKGGKDWLRYVSERFFAIEELVKARNLEHFWHFDSDTIILHNLYEYENSILEQGFDCTTLCNGTCPSGFITSSLLKSYTQSMINDYKDLDFIRSQQNEFNTVNTSYAFTEMRAFLKFKESSPVKCPHLASLFISQRIWFDDCICQPDIFKTFRVARIDRSLKAFYWIDQRICAQTIDGDVFDFATVNGSWVPLEVFEWFMLGSTSTLSTPKSLSDHMSVSINQRIVAKINSIYRKLSRQ